MCHLCHKQIIGLNLLLQLTYLQLHVPPLHFNSDDYLVVLDVFGEQQMHGDAQGEAGKGKGRVEGCAGE
jgi:hypothetical protein